MINRDDIPFPCNTVFNAGAVKYKDEYILLLRVETLEGWSCFVITRSNYGYNFSIEEEPVMKPADRKPFSTCKKGLEDPCIAYFEDGKYVDEDGKVMLKYGAADTSICLATCGVEDLLSSIKRIDQ